MWIQGITIIKKQYKINLNKGEKIRDQTIPKELLIYKSLWKA